MAAKIFVEEIIKKYGKHIMVTTTKDKKGKYGRYIASIWFADYSSGDEVEWFDLSSLLITEGHAKQVKY